MNRVISAIAACAVMLLLNPGGTRESSGAMLLDRIVAVVNQEVITWSELMNSIIIDGRQYLAEERGEARERKIREMQRPFLNNLIEMKLQLQNARTMDLSVTDGEVDGAIEEIRKKYDLTKEALLDSLRAEGLSEQEYRAGLSDQILLQKVINAAVRSTVVVSEKDVDQYLEENPGLFDTEEKLRVSQIFFSTPQEESRRSSLEELARELVSRIRNGEDFAGLAREYSQGPNREVGGDLGFITRGSMLKEIEDVAGSLKEGEVSEPFWSSAGLHIIRLEERIEASEKERTRSTVREALSQAAFEKKYRDWLAGLKESAYIDIKL